jgi:hypothetical protein
MLSARVSGITTRLLWLALGLGGTASPTLGAPWTVAAERHDRSPLPIDDVFLLGAPVLRLEPQAAEALPPGRWRLRAALSAANSFSRSEAVEEALEQRDSREPLGLDELRNFPAIDGEPTRFLIDGEVERLELGVARGLGGGWQVEATLPLFETGGGFLDETIEDFHEARGITQQGRDGLPRNAFLLYLSGPRGELFVNKEPGGGVGEPTLSAVRQLGWRPLGIELALRGAVKLPTASGRTLHGTGSLDVGLETHGRRCGGVWCGHGSFGLYRLGEWALLRLAERSVAAGALAGQLLLPAGNSLLAQAMCSGEPLGPLAIAELSGDACELSGGWRRSGRDSSWSIAFTENLFVSDTGSDFALHLVWSHGR